MKKQGEAQDSRAKATHSELLARQGSRGSAPTSRWGTHAPPSRTRVTTGTASGTALRSTSAMEPSCKLCRSINVSEGGRKVRYEEVPEEVPKLGTQTRCLRMSPSSLVT